MSEQDLYSAMLASMKEFQDQLCTTMREWQAENREAIKRIQQIMDVQVAKEPISRPNCEDYRAKCGAKVCAKIQQAQGYPKWLAWTLTGAFSALFTLITYIVTTARAVGR